ncbi:MAG: DUF3015 domain-containing protein [bacterium]|nr:DUF3015 domain-containing protein [bacterium]
MKAVRLVVTAMIVALAPAGFAVADNDIGCGVGTEIMKGEQGLPAKLVGSCINGLTFQSISITFGLVNCDGQGKVTADNSDFRVEHFASRNFDRLSVEMAQGGGEHLDAFAGLLDVRADQRAAFAALTQTHFETLFPNDQTTVGEMLSALDQLIAKSEIL